MRDKEPKISVIMSVFNTNEFYLRESIESILNQSFRDFEFIIVNDCSTDKSLDIIMEYSQTDKRIRVIRNSKNLGLTKSLNIALDNSRGKYIARMDADDVSLEKRLEKQFLFMEERSDVTVLGTHVYMGKDIGLINRGFNKNREIDRVQMLFHNAGIAHPTAMIRKSFLVENNIHYDEEIKKSQDYALWLECINCGGTIELLDEILLIYRIHEGQISNSKREQNNYAMMVMKKALEHFGGFYDESEKALHCTIAEGIPYDRKRNYINYFDKLKKYNQQNNVYNNVIFENQLKCLWLKLAIRRVKYLKKMDYIMSFQTVRCCTPQVFYTYYVTYVKNCRHYEKIKRRFIEENK